MIKINNASESDLLFDHAQHSVGGIRGHAFRRITHLSMSLVPIIYYIEGENVAAVIQVNTHQLVSLVCITILLLEAIRLKFEIVVIGQRSYESKQVSALAWGALSTSLVFLIAPEGDLSGIKSGLFGIPLIFGVTFVDPLMGEIKRQKKNMKVAIISGLICSYTIWLGCSLFLGTPIILSIILAPLTVLGEIPQLKYIDDNATMILFPLTAMVILLPFV